MVDSSLPHPDTRPGDATIAANALPRPLTTFVGREREREAVGALLARDDVRLLTLTGPGGVGKTRLAHKVAEEAQDTFPDGAWFVALASVSDPALVPAAIVGSLNLAPAGRLDEHERLVTHFSRRKALLVLDNFEQLLDAGMLVVDLLISCPDLKILVTSRVNLNVSGESLYSVPPLGLPDHDANQDFDKVRASDAVRLFTERACARASDFELTARNAPAVAEICRRLDGLPLAIELAAARINVFSPADLLGRLDARLALLTDGTRDQPPRLQSLRGSISWSYELLSPEERTLFRRLGVFPGSWTLKAAEAIVYTADEHPGLTVMDGIASLVNRNLVRQELSPSGESRYVMLEAIREFATELFINLEDTEAIRWRHAEYIHTLAKRAAVGVYMPDGIRHVDQMRVLSASVQDALEWIEQCNNTDEMLRLTSALVLFWNLNGRLREVLAWLERAVAVARDSDSPLLGRSLIALSLTLHMLGDEPAALAYCEAGLSRL